MGPECGSVILGTTGQLPQPGTVPVEVFSLQSRKLTRTLTVGGEPRRIAFSQQGKIGAISNMAGFITFVR